MPKPTPDAVMDKARAILSKSEPSSLCPICRHKHREPSDSADEPDVALVDAWLAEWRDRYIADYLASPEVERAFLELHWQEHSTPVLRRLHAHGELRKRSDEIARRILAAFSKTVTP